MSNEEYGLLDACFSGCDTVAFFGGKYMVTLAHSMTRNSMRVIFPVVSGIERFLYSNNRVDFHLVSVNENGRMGLISGNCIVDDFKASMSIDDLSIEATVDFKSTITRIIGHWSNDKAEQEEIRAIYQTLKEKK